MKPSSLSTVGDGAADDDGKQSAKRSAVARPSRVVCVVLLTTMFWGVIFLLHDSTSLQLGNAPFFSHLKMFQFGLSDKCDGRYVYMYDLPPRFNADLVGDCSGPNASTDKCKHAANGGFGPVITGGGGGELPERGVYDTDQFSLSMIFHARMKQHECLTSRPAAAAAVYIPFYAGLDVERYLGQEHNDSSASDALARGLVEWLLARPEWRVMGGRDHFMNVARGSWDFLRTPDVPGRGNSRCSRRRPAPGTASTSPCRSRRTSTPPPTPTSPAGRAACGGWSASGCGDSQARPVPAPSRPCAPRSWSSAAGPAGAASSAVLQGTRRAGPCSCWRA
ncbi:hypothetical protein ACQ4PT_037775 [Festuca glaucescens]